MTQNCTETPKKLTTIIRQSEQAYVGICLEVNVAAQGETISEVKSNLVVAVHEYLDYAKETELDIEPIPIQELIEFFEDTSLVEVLPGTENPPPMYTFHQLLDAPQYA